MTESRKSVLLVLRELLARRITGALAVTSPDATGEVRLRLGTIEEVVFGRAEGVKALARMLAVEDLRFAFREGDGGRGSIDVPAEELLARATAARDALVAASAPFESRRDSYAIGAPLTEASGAVLSTLARALWARLRSPAGFSEVTDLLPDRDDVILAALAELEAASAVRWLEFESERQPLGAAHWESERVREHFGDKVRLVIAGTPHRVAVFRHALFHVDEVLRPTEDEPLVPMPHVVASIPLEAGGCTVDVIVCPLVPVYSPLWPLSLASSALVVRLDEAAPGLLESACELAGARVVAAEALVGPFDEGRVGAVAALVRAALEEAVATDG